jgi:A/G-specific adenine glycosylase
MLCIAPPLLTWFSQNRRSLPFRDDPTPYHIWISEIMLQQTRMTAVLPYYERFVRELPDPAALAACSPDRLHKLWEGLGYYSRVRNLKKAAQQILELHNGVFPGTHAEVSNLAGIGPYTAGAICSIAFGLPTPAVDGNVLRVITRLTDDDTPIDQPALRKQITANLAAVYPKQAGDFTQALMELGATLCGPNWEPRCEECPCKGFCGGYIHGSTKEYPVKLPKKAKRVEERTVFILSCDGCYALRKRPDSGLLAGLWEFPNVEGKLDVPAALTAAEKLGIRPRNIRRQLQRKHIFTHIRWEMTGYFLETAEKSGDFVWMSADRIEQEAALPTAFRQFWEEREDV